MNWQQEQQAFWEWMTRPQDLRLSADAIDTLMSPHQALSQVEALAIYNNAYHQRVIQISSELYPVLYHTLGDDVYTRLWLEYIAQYPPRPGPMGLLGEHLLEFARQHAQFGQLPALLDIIKLESLLISLFDTADELPLTRQMLQSLPADQWPEMCWAPRQDWALMDSRFDMEAYWLLMQTHMEKENAVAGETGFAVPLHAPEQTAFYVVRRVNHRMQFQRINQAMMVFLLAIQQRVCFAGQCEQLAEQFPQEDIAQLSLTLLLKSIDLQLIRA